MGEVERGPNYDWQHEAKHFQEECNKLRDQLGRMEHRWETEVASLQSRLSRATEALEFYRDGEPNRIWSASIMGDGGRTARAAIAELKGGGE